MQSARCTRSAHAQRSPRGTRTCSFAHCRAVALTHEWPDVEPPLLSASIQDRQHSCLSEGRQSVPLWTKPGCHFQVRIRYQQSGTHSLQQWSSLWKLKCKVRWDGQGTGHSIRQPHSKPQCEMVPGLNARLPASCAQRERGTLTQEGHSQEVPTSCSALLAAGWDKKQQTRHGEMLH